MCSSKSTAVKTIHKTGFQRYAPRHTLNTVRCPKVKPYADDVTMMFLDPKTRVLSLNKIFIFNINTLTILKIVVNVPGRQFYLLHSDIS